MQHTSCIIEYLDLTTIVALKQELSNIPADWWTSHFAGEYEITGALRHGKTCWLNKLDHNLIPMISRVNQFSESKKIIDKLLNKNMLGRAYWHRLMPGDIINRHHDRNLGFSDKVLHRYQIYLDIPSNVELIIDDAVAYPANLQNCILDFNMYMPHSYANKSNSELIFMVIDILIP